MFIEPKYKFKVGDKVIVKSDGSIVTIFDYFEYSENPCYYVQGEHNDVYYESALELYIEHVKPSFKPYDKVLVRDKNGDLCLYSYKPRLSKDGYWYDDDNADVLFMDGSQYFRCIQLKYNVFPKITFENSPKELVIK